LFSACRSNSKEEEKKSSKIVKTKEGKGISIVIYASGEGSKAKEFVESGGEGVIKFLEVFLLC